MGTATSVKGAVGAVGASEGEAIWFNGALIRVKSPGEWSDGAFSLVEVAMPQGRATGLHRDPSHETFHILEGELLLHLDGGRRPAGEQRPRGRDECLVRARLLPDSARAGI